MTCSGKLQVLRASFGKINERFQFFHFVINGFHVFGNKFFSDKNKYYIILLFSFWSNCYLVSLMRGHIINFKGRCQMGLVSQNLMF